jgi:hypothetical protein
MEQLTNYTHGSQKKTLLIRTAYIDQKNNQLNISGIKSHGTQASSNYIMFKGK